MNNRYGMPELDDAHDKGANSPEAQAHREWVRKQLEEICGPPVTLEERLRRRFTSVEYVWTTKEEGAGE